MRSDGVPQYLWLGITSSDSGKVSGRTGSNRHLIFVMIAGNPKSCRTMAAFAVVLVVLIAVSVGFIAARKRTAPLKAMPLHPSTIVLRVR
jgi:hypothetical protein